MTPVPRSTTPTSSTRATRGEPPSRIVVSTEDVERGVHWRPCPECNGMGIFDLPDTYLSGRAERVAIRFLTASPGS
jgi:hypothetical protein